VDTAAMFVLMWCLQSTFGHNGREKGSVLLLSLLLKNIESSFNFAHNFFCKFTNCKIDYLFCQPKSQAKDEDDSLDDIFAGKYLSVD
jgi:hypothetical protein